MEKRIFLIRHCEASGQPPEANLTEKGFSQAQELAVFFSNVRVDRIISSPFMRAIQSIEPLAEKMRIKVEIDERLSERILSKRLLPDWMEKLEATFMDLDLEWEGGESSRNAMMRVVNVVKEALQSKEENILMVTHGNLMALLIKHYQHEFNFEEWKKLRNPDVFQLHFIDNRVNVKRIWKEDGVSGTVTGVNNDSNC
jgi:2,3-bisphosphoglycerate-dependent phosphoglycerate mutase